VPTDGGHVRGLEIVALGSITCGHGRRNGGDDADDFSPPKPSHLLDEVGDEASQLLLALQHLVQVFMRLMSHLANSLLQELRQMREAAANAVHHQALDDPGVNVDDADFAAEEDTSAIPLAVGHAHPQLEIAVEGEVAKAPTSFTQVLLAPLRALFGL
jgi:hypothetical protein